MPAPSFAVRFRDAAGNVYYLSTDDTGELDWTQDESRAADFADPLDAVKMAAVQLESLGSDRFGYTVQICP